MPALLLLVAVPGSAPADVPKEISLATVDTIVTDAMKAFDDPGMAVAIVRDGKVVLCKGYGVREMGKPDPVTPHTLFAIGSCSKAFTSTAMAMLVDDGKAAWDSPVRQYLPFFHVGDTTPGGGATFRDLLTHRTGVPRSDLLWYGSTWNREDLVRRASLLGARNAIRTNYEYNNLMYTTAGYAIEVASGMTYEQFVQKRILQPLGMDDVDLDVADAQKSPDHATPHTIGLDRKLMTEPWRQLDNMAPAGGINASIEDMAKWALFQLGDGTWNGKRLVSETNFGEPHRPQMLIPGSDSPNDPIMTAYGMGWMVLDRFGVKVYMHNGLIDGFMTEVALLPWQKTGIVILSNTDRPASTAVRRGLMAYLGGYEDKTTLSRTVEGEKKAFELQEQNNKQLLAKKIAGTKPSKALADYAGSYSDPAFGQVEIELHDGKLLCIFHGIRYLAEHFHYDTFLSRQLLTTNTVDALSTWSFSLGPDGSVESVRWTDADGTRLATFSRETKK